MWGTFEEYDEIRNRYKISWKEQSVISGEEYMEVIPGSCEYFEADEIK